MPTAIPPDSPPPYSLTHLWYISPAGAQYGPVRAEEFIAALRAGTVPLTTPVWMPGMPAWQSAHTIHSLVAQAPPATSGHSPLAPISAVEPPDAERLVGPRITGASS